MSTPDGAQTVAATIDACAGVVTETGGLVPQSGEDLDAVRRSWQDSFASNVLTSVLLVEACARSWRPGPAG